MCSNFVESIYNLELVQLENGWDRYSVESWRTFSWDLASVPRTGHLVCRPCWIFGIRNGPFCARARERPLRLLCRSNVEVDFTFTAQSSDRTLGLSTCAPAASTWSARGLPVPSVKRLMSDKEGAEEASGERRETADGRETAVAQGLKSGGNVLRKSMGKPKGLTFGATIGGGGNRTERASAEVQGIGAAAAKVFAAVFSSQTIGLVRGVLPEIMIVSGEGKAKATTAGRFGRERGSCTYRHRWRRRRRLSGGGRRSWVSGG